MKAVKEIINARFEFMSFKEEIISTQPSYSSDNVKTFAETIHLVNKSIDLSQLTKSDLKKYDDLQVFMASHCHATYYEFHA